MSLAAIEVILEDLDKLDELSEDYEINHSIVIFSDYSGHVNINSGYEKNEELFSFDNFSDLSAKLRDAINAAKEKKEKNEK